MVVYIGQHFLWKQSDRLKKYPDISRFSPVYSLPLVQSPVSEEDQELFLRTGWKIQRRDWDALKKSLDRREK
jgi:hypothetical protein